MLLPNDLAGMRLGAAGVASLPHRPPLAQATPLPGSWGREQSAQRVEGMNHLCGDCVWTALANAARTALRRAGVTQDSITDELPRQLYIQNTGYRPGDPSTDRGTDVEAALDWWHENSIAGTRLYSHCRLDNTHLDEVRRPIMAVGGVLTIVNLSVEMQNQRLLLPVGRPGSWGRHAKFDDQWTGRIFWGTSWGNGLPADSTLMVLPEWVDVYELVVDIE